jgi:hypothetical protein
MLISKSTGSWGDGADEATFNLEVVGHSPDEVENLKKLVDHKDPCVTAVSFDNGTLKVELKFTRKVPLEVQRKHKAEAEAKENAKHAPKPPRSKAHPKKHEKLAKKPLHK